MEKVVPIHQISKNFFSKLPHFDDKFKYVAKNIEKFCFFLLHI
jgi:hypothetical protein